MSVSILTLVGLTIKLILIGVESKNAVEQISRSHNVSFNSIWRELPDIFK